MKFLCLKRDDHSVVKPGELFKGENPSLSILGDFSLCQGGLGIFLPANSTYALCQKRMQNLPAKGTVTTGSPVNLLVREVGPVITDPCLFFQMASEK